MKVLGLFSGIGGFELGLQRAGFEIAAMCEIDPFCQRVLAKHWPGVPIYEDVRELTGERLAADGIGADVICGGFPCQDVSNAGARTGIEGERSGLWREIARLASQVRPRVIFLENTTGLLSRGLGRVLGDLAALGFDAEWHCIPASSLGAPHPRDRVWIIANAAALRRHEGQWPEEGWGRLLRHRKLDSPNAWASGENNNEIRSMFLRIVDRIPDRVDRLGALGNAVVPQIPELIGRAIKEAPSTNGAVK